MNKRIYRILFGLIITMIVMMLLVGVTPSNDAPRILIMLGGTMPEGIIQGVTYFFFIFGIMDVIYLLGKISDEKKVLSQHLLPEKENWILDAEDANKIKLDIQQIEHTQKFLLTDLIIKACTKYRLSKSSAEVISLVDAQIRIYNEKYESEQSFISYAAWAVPSVGFIGTVLGIAASLGYTNEASTPEGLEKVTSMLAVAFDTTLVALVLSIILMWGIHYLRKQQDSLFADLNSYIIENLINRFYK
ncbi:MotA/TolQ/ExbB proton channel family protein [Barnesiella sp. An22]|uniref:MotA/TolQ/ExbB proton channel family protein n=1 Tax=Barnesiella sp. An22 TaxID=1965590 RepID=UPI000B37EA43|nr:MotA/TolQ/ExbB proton channel family protein [Barnesiella sp. An22]OUO96218.1 hypothetical protein B5F38_13370 [Barnesiella sp. An22]